ncbi:four-helix bundle copper-binding protein [Inediibacterium massiliense]|uniref:four-helix bundle copper-binding protein n=1 Tax=Inediibacterium massiliense TaxID=1658111 RepID=UPI0006B51CB1|nr:four-helix bundle copper-binding protein [Inediibacterium massiliense]
MSENFVYNNLHSPCSPLLMTVQNCEANYEHMTTFLKCKKDVQSRVIQLQLLRDCADICTLMAKYLARNSVFSKCLANLCAYICEVCGTECSKFPDPESQHCAQICFHCARECRAFAMMA